ncbi:MAG: CopG family ribbon-helix-helix protein [Pseudomonadota bacterium]
MAATKIGPLAFRVDAARHARLAHLAAATDRPKSWPLQQALDAYLDAQLWQVEQIRLGIAELDAGKRIPHQEVMAGLRRRIAARAKSGTSARSARR